MTIIHPKLSFAIPLQLSDCHKVTNETIWTTISNYLLTKSLLSFPDCVPLVEHGPGVSVRVADGRESLVRDGDDHEDGAHVADRGEGPEEVREEGDVRPGGQAEVLPG